MDSEVIISIALIFGVVAVTAFIGIKVNSKIKSKKQVLKNVLVGGDVVGGNKITKTKK